MDNNFGTISLDEEQPFGNVSLNAAYQAPSVPPEIAQPKAAKAHFGLGDQSPGFDTLYNGIANGQEAELRQNVSRQYDSYLRLQKQSALMEIAQQGAMGNVEHAKALIDWNPQTNPETVFEKTYAQQYVSKVAQNDTATTVSALAQDSETAHGIMDATQNTIANQEALRKISKDLEDRQNLPKPYEQGSLSEYPVSPAVTAMVTPFVSALNMRNILAVTSSILPGNNLDEQITYWWTLPPEQAVPLLNTAVHRLEQINPHDARAFVDYLNDFSEQDRINLNVQAALDATIVGGPLLKLRNIMRGAVKGNAPKNMNIGNALEAIGDTEKASEVKAVEVVRAKSQPVVLPVADRGYDPLGQKLDLSSVLPSNSNPKSLATPNNLGSMSREGALRIVGRLEQQNELIDKTMEGLVSTARLTPERLQHGLGETVDAMKFESPHVQDTLLDFRTSNVHPWEHIRAQDTPTKVDYVMMNVGKGGKVERLENDLGFPLGPTAVSTDEIEFTTAKGSKYKLHADNTTTRNKAARADPGHEGDSGPKPKSEKTVYLTNEQAQALAPAQGKWRIIDHENGMLSTAMYNESGPNKGKYGISPEANNVKYSTSPTKGLIPLELWKVGETYGKKSFSELHFGNEIVGIKTKGSNYLTAKEAVWGETVIGRQDATLFKTAEQADRFAQEQLGFHYQQYRVMNGPGDKWYISVVKPVDETTGPLRELELELNNTNLPTNTIAGYFGGYARTPADQVAPFLRNNRLLATTASSAIHGMIKRLIEPIADLRQYPLGGKTVGNVLLGKTSYEKLTDVLRWYNVFQDYSKPMSRGTFPTSMAQLSKDWKKVTGKLPNERESLAFWTAVKLNDFDWTLRNYNLHRDLARQGIEHVAIPHPTEEGVYTKPFWGKVVKHEDFPWSNTEDAELAIYRDGKYSHFSKNTVKIADTDETKNIKAWMERPSVKITQLAIPEGRPLKELLNFDPHFVISEDIQRSPLPVKLVDYNPGGHVIYPASHYAKQPDIQQGRYGKFYHYGDKTLMGFQTEAQGKRYTPRLEKFRQMLRAGKTDAELEAFVNKNLPEDIGYWKGKFVGKNAIFSVDHPIVLTRKSQTSFETNPTLKEKYRDALGQDVVSYPDSSYNLSKGVDKSFLQDRDGPLSTISSTGYNPWNPVYKLEQAPILKPMYAMERGLYNAVRGVYLNDVKIATVEQWIRQYRGLFEDEIDKVMRNPYFYFYQKPLIKGDKYQIQSAENARRNLKNFLKVSSDLQGDIDTVNEILMNKLYAPSSLTGEVGTDALANWYASKDWNVIKHPVDFLRSASSNLIFGHYNPIQAVKQTLGATYAVAIDPAYGYQGATAALLHNFHRLGQNHLPEAVSEGVLKALDRMAILGGWTKGQFANSVRAMERVDFDHVGREVAWRDSITGDKLFGTGYQNYLDKSYVFFNWGDRNNRMVAWHMAYKRFVQDNPSRIIDDRSLGEILNRADLLSANMTKESNSAMQKGVLGPLLQFRSFQMRIFEQMTGSRLTKEEKMKAFIASSVMFGVPVTIGAYVLPVEDIYSDIKGYMIKNGMIEPDGKGFNTIANVLQDGIIDHVIHMSTGTRYNPAKAFGPGPDQSISKALQDGVTDVLSLAPAGSLLENMFKLAYPLSSGIRTANNPDGGYQVTNAEILDVARSIKSIDLMYNMYMAANYQKAVGKNKQIVADDMTKTDAVMMALGLTRMDITEKRLGQAIAHDQGAFEDKQGKLALEEYRKALQAGSEGDFKKFDVYLRNAHILLNELGDVSEQKKDQLWKQALDESPTLAERVNQLLYDSRRIPPSQIPSRLKKHFGIEVNQ